MSEVPAWLQIPNPIAYYHPEHLLFVPQRLMTQRNGYPSLLDYTDRSYYLHHCEKPQLEHLNGVTLFITDGGNPLSIYLDRASGLHIVSNGQRRVRIDLRPQIMDGLQAAQDLAAMFNGHIFTEHL